MRTLGVVLLCTTQCANAAIAPLPLPEPGTLELLSIGVIAAIVVAIRKRGR